MAEESETSAAASCGGNWWNAVSTGSGSSLVFNILDNSHRQQEAASTRDIQTLNWSSCSGIPTSVTAIGSEEVDNLPGTIGSEEVDNLSGTIVTGGGGSSGGSSTSTTNTSSTLSSMSTEAGSLTRRRQQQEQELVDSASFLEQHMGQFAVHGGVPDNQNIWSQVLLGGSDSSSQGMQSRCCMQNNHLHLQETLYTTALGQELDLAKNEPQPCSRQLKKTHENISTGWEFRNLAASFPADDMSISMNMNLKTQMPAVAPPLIYSVSGSSSHPLPDLGSWSAAVPEQTVNVLARNININSINSLNAFSNSNSSEGSSDLNMAQFDVSRIKQEFPVPPYTGSLGVSLNSPNTRLLQGFGADAEADFKNDSSFSHILDPAATKPFLKSMATIVGDEYRGGWPSNSTCLSQPLPSSSSRPSVLNFGNLDFSACKANQMKRQHAHVTTADRSIQLYPDKKQIQTVLAQNRTVPNGDEARDSTTDTKRSSCTDQNAADTVFKRPRLETSSTIPTFKVRKEKLGDRITALQQIVSPFGKTDTASVLLEAIGYIKFLQEQVQVLSTPYMKSGGTPNQGEQKVWGSSDRKDSDEPNSDLRSRGLCLVPVSCTLHVANDNGADYWTPSLGGTYR